MTTDSLKSIVPVIKTIDERNVCILSEPKCEMVYASVTLRGGYYTETNPAHLGITHLIEHILFESWKKCYMTLPSKTNIKIKTKTNAKTRKTMKAKAIAGPKKSCLHFWNNRPVSYNGFTDNQHVTAYIYGLASESSNIVDYITQMICSCKTHLNMKLLAHIKNTVLNELTAGETNSMRKLEYALISRHIAPKISESSSGALHIGNATLQIENLRKLTPEHIKDYYYRFFIPQNAFFFYSGCVTEHQIRASISAHLLHSQSQSNISINKSLNSNRTNVAFEPSRIFTRQFFETNKGTNKGLPIPITIVKDPSVKNNALFMIIFPMKQLFDSIVETARTTQVLTTLVKRELMELLRMEHNLVYGVDAACSTLTGINTFRIFGSCLYSNVELVIELCISYIRERQRKRVPESKLDAAKGNIKMATHVSSHSLVSISNFFERLITLSMIHGSETINPSDMKLGSYDASVKQIDRITASEIREYFKCIRASKAVSGYSIR